MYDIVNEGIMITLRYQTTKPEPLSDKTPAVNNIQISGINIRGAQRPVAIFGLEERDVSEISFSDMRIFSDKGILLENSSGISFHDVRMDIKQGSPLEAKDSKNITWDLVSVNNIAKDLPILNLINCQKIKVSNCYQSDNLSRFISADDKSSDIYIVNNVLPNTNTLCDGKGKNIVARNNTSRNEK
jgi:hypothetical protein